MICIYADTAFLTTTSTWSPYYYYYTIGNALHWFSLPLIIIDPAEFWQMVKHFIWPEMMGCWKVFNNLIAAKQSDSCSISIADSEKCMWLEVIFMCCVSLVSRKDFLLTIAFLKLLIFFYISTLLPFQVAALTKSLIPDPSPSSLRRRNPICPSLDIKSLPD